MPALHKKQIRFLLKRLPDWSQRGQTIYRTYTFKSFPGSITFVNRIARLAQKNKHHPDINIRYDKVKLALTTHDEGGLTNKDFVLARQCNATYQKIIAKI